MSSARAVQKATAAGVALCIAGIGLLQLTPAMKTETTTANKPTPTVPVLDGIGTRNDSSDRDSIRKKREEIVAHMQCAAEHGMQSKEFQEALGFVGPWATTTQRPSDNLAPAKVPSTNKNNPAVGRERGSPPNRVQEK
jgi:hypothetical protein